MNTTRNRPRQESVRTVRPRTSFSRLFAFSLLLVACFLVGFFLIGPRIGKTTTGSSLSVQAPTPPSSPVTDSSVERPRVRVTERKLPRPAESREQEKTDTDNDIKLEIEQPVSQVEDTSQIQEDTEDAAVDEGSQVLQLYRVEVKGFADESSAGKAADILSAKGYAPVINKVITDSGSSEYRVQVGAFQNIDNANRVADDVRSAGLNVSVSSPEE